MSAVNKTGRGLSPWKWLLAPGMVAMIVMSYVWAGPNVDFISPQTARIIFWHVPMAILSMLWFFIAAWYACRVLWSKDPFADTRSSKAAEVGLLVTVLATITGAVFSKMQWQGGLNTPWYYGYWQWDPKQTAIAIVIVIFMAYFGLRMSVDNPETRARLSAVYVIIGAVAVPYLYYTLPQLPIFGQSVHPTDVIKKGMDTPYRATFYLSTLLFFGFSLWGYQLQLRLARLAERRGALAEGAAEPRFEAVRKPVPEQ
jgi:heme exporter protein C